MRIKMTRTEKGSIDGINVRTYEAGSEHDLTASHGARALAGAFVGADMAVEIVAPHIMADAPSSSEVDFPVRGDVAGGVIKARKGKGK